MSASDRKLRFGILGLSLSHPYAFAPYLKDRGHSIAAVWDPNAQKAAEFVETHGGAVLAQPEDGIGQVDAIINSSIISDHPALAIPYLEAGVPVYVDKFLSPRLDESEAMIAAAQKGGTMVTAASSIRYLPAFQEMARKVKSEELGKALVCNGTVYHDMAQYLKPEGLWQDNVQQSGGNLMNMGIHAIDPLVHAFGPNVEAVACASSKRVYEASQSEDQAVLLLRWPDGLLGTMHIVCGVKGHRYTCSVTCETGDIDAAPGAEPANIYGPMLDAFVDGVITRTWPIPAGELLATVRILSAAREAAATGEWVRLS